jgi:hypothetical protein
MNVQTTHANQLVKQIESVHSKIMISRAVWMAQDPKYLTAAIKAAREDNYLQLCEHYLKLKTTLSDHQETIKALLFIGCSFEIKNGLIYV